MSKTKERDWTPEEFQAHTTKWAKETKRADGRHVIDQGWVQLNLARVRAKLEVLRLMLGTSLDVSEDVDDVPESDPRSSQVAVYRYLSYLQEMVVEALAGW